MKFKHSRLTKHGFAVPKIDTHIGKWVEQKGDLVNERPFLESIKHLIPVGGTVIDVGAFIGDHTLFYADRVGPTGSVVAIEANPDTFETLEYNMQTKPWVECFNLAMSDKLQECLKVNRLDNVGASYLEAASGIELRDREVSSTTLDNQFRMQVFKQIDFMKIDAEGFETKVLRGGTGAIMACKPIILTEVNDGALQRQGSSAAELLATLVDLGYSYELAKDGLSEKDGHYNIICTPQ